MTDKKIVPFNPLDKRHLGETVAQALLKQEAQPLGQLQPFTGSGIYAIYYVGDFPAYQAIAKVNRNGQFRAPIYAGKAVPTGHRKGSSLTTTATGRTLHKRLSEHAKSIVQAENLMIEDFFFRALVVDDIWIPLGEALLISKFTPLWNSLIDGFGNHDPGKGRHKGVCPRWDVLHPGRPWASRLEERAETADRIGEEAAHYLTDHPPPDDPLIVSS